MVQNKEGRDSIISMKLITTNNVMLCLGRVFNELLDIAYVPLPWLEPKHDL